MSTTTTNLIVTSDNDTTTTTTTLTTKAEINDESTTQINTSLGVLNWQQVNKLDSLLSKPIPIHGRGTYPTLTVRLKDFIRNLNKRLVEQCVRVRDIRINGGVASYVLAKQDDYEFSDIDIIFSCDLLQLNEPYNLSDLTPEQAFSNCCDIIKQTVFECLLDYFPNNNNNRDKINVQILKEAYVKKMVKIYQQSSSSKENVSNSSTNLAASSDFDSESAESMQSSSRWSLISLCNNQGQNIELKFVDKMKRQFQFSVDAFQIHLASLLKYYDLANDDVDSIQQQQQTMNENIYPTVIAESMYGEFDEANYHLNEKLIATKSPEEIRGGGLLKYCNLLVRGYKPVNGAESQMNTMEKYMCSRFFIDFSDLSDQEHKLNAYLDCHFQNAPHMCVLYLKKLYEVVNLSTVCLMGHERKQTLNLIDSLAKRYHQHNQFQSDEFNEQNDNDSESVNSDSSSLSSSSSSLFQQQQQKQKNYHSHHHNHHHYHNHHHHNHNQPQRIHYRNNRLYHNKTPNSSSNASSPSSSSSILFDSTNTHNYSGSPPNDSNYNSNQMYYINYSNYKHHQQQQQQQQQKHQHQQQQVIITTNSNNKLTIPFSSSSSLSSSSSSVVSSPSPSPPLTTTPTSTTILNTNIPFYITISTPTPQEIDENNYDYENENTTPKTNSSTTVTSVFQCKIPTQYYPIIEVFNYYSPPVITTPLSSLQAAGTAPPSCLSSSNTSSPVYFYTDPTITSNNQDNITYQNNIITRIIPSKSYQFCCSPTNDYHNYVNSIQQFQPQLQQVINQSKQQEITELTV